jgi:hypothetical protein
MNLSENIKNAFNVVKKTYENVDKLMKYCDSIANNCGYEAVTEKFLRYKSDSYYGGWLIDSFIKLYQSKNDKIMENEWKDGPIFSMELSFENEPIVYLAKFEYDNISGWSKGTISPTAYWVFSESIDCEGSEFKEENLDNKDGYRVSEPESQNIKEKYWGIKRIVYTTVDLLQLDSNNISGKVFGEFDILRNL